MKAATITIRAARNVVLGAIENAPMRSRAFGDDNDEIRFSLIDADGRGVELHASSPSLDQKAMKSGLRRYRSLLEAGEIPTGDRRR